DTKALVEALNQLLQAGQCLYAEDSFKDVTFRDETAELLKLPLQGDGLIYLNRLLLEDAYPDAITKMHDVHEERLSQIRRDLHEKKPAALCLSGGGIRSATFGLGILQGLATHRLLGEFHYLSTVSGGGYVGSWLTAWIHRDPEGAPGVFA